MWSLELAERPGMASQPRSKSKGQHKSLRESFTFCTVWWAIEDSNLWPLACKASALTN